MNVRTGGMRDIDEREYSVTKKGGLLKDSRVV